MMTASKSLCSSAISRLSNCWSIANSRAVSVRTASTGSTRATIFPPGTWRLRALE